MRKWSAPFLSWHVPHEDICSTPQIPPSSPLQVSSGGGLTDTTTLGTKDP